MPEHQKSFARQPKEHKGKRNICKIYNNSSSMANNRLRPPAAQCRFRFSTFEDSQKGQANALGQTVENETNRRAMPDPNEQEGNQRRNCRRNVPMANGKSQPFKVQI